MCVVETESLQSVWLKLKVCSVCVGGTEMQKVSELFAYLNKHPIQLMVASTFREPVPNSSHK